MSNVIHVTDSSFQQNVIQSELPVLLEFWAEWSGPCRSVGPIMEELASEYAGRLVVAKLNVDENDQTAVLCGIRNLPTVLLYKGGEVIGKQAGAAPKSWLESLIDHNL